MNLHIFKNPFFLESFFKNFQSKSRYLYLFILLFNVTFLMSCVEDSSHDPGPGGQINTLECIVPNIIRNPKIEYDYMFRQSFPYNESLYIFNTDYFSSFENAFKQRGYVYLDFNKSFNDSVIGTRCTYKLLYSNSQQSMDSFTWSNRNYLLSQRFYLCSIDSFYNDQFPERMGLTKWYSNNQDSLNKRRGYSFIFSGKIRNRNCWGMSEYEHYATAHELGHLFGLMLDNDNRHGGENSTYCLMRYASICDNIDPIRSNFAICDTYTCDIYIGAILQQSPLGYAQSFKKFPQNLQFKLTLNKDNLIEGEPIFIKLTVLNTGNTIDSLSEYNLQSFHNWLKFKSNKNLKIVGTQEWSNFAYMRYYKIKPNENISLELELSEYWGTKYIEADGDNRTYYFVEDNYAVEYISGDDMLNRMYNSNTVNFEVKKPEDINSEIFNELLKIQKLKEWDEKGLKERYNAIVKLMYNYRQNPYTEKIYDLYNACCSALNIKDSLIEKNIWFIENYPNSFYNKYIVYHTLRAAFKLREGEKGVNEIIDLIKMKVPNTRASSIAEEYGNSKKYLQEGIEK